MLWSLLKYVPKNIVSYLTGVLVGLPLPRPLRVWSMKWFARRYRINLDEAEFPIEQYRSINHLFTRRLKPGLRPVSGSVIHPCDANLTEAGVLKDGTLIQAKGKNYLLSDLLSDSKDAEYFEGGRYLTYYLCPTDYHRVHSPVTGQLNRVVYVPGALWPVNAWSVSNVDRLFAVNERVVMHFKVSHERGEGRAAVVMVGATNVGKITLAFDPAFVSNAILKSRRRTERSYNPPFSIRAGDEIGIFNMGSTVIVIYDSSFFQNETPFARGPVKLGQRLEI